MSIRSCDVSIDSGNLANIALKGIGSGGGHATMAGGFVPYPENMSSVDMFVREIEERFMDELAKLK